VINHVDKKLASHSPLGLHTIKMHIKALELAKKRYLCVSTRTQEKPLRSHRQHAPQNAANFPKTS